MSAYRSYPPPPELPAGPRGRWTRVWKVASVIGVVAAVIVVGAGLYLFVSVIGDPNARQTGGPMRVPVGRTALLVMHDGLGGEVDVRSVRPIVRDNSADADVTVVYCIPPGPGKPEKDRFIGGGCAATPPMQPGRVVLDYYVGSFALTVTPRRPGQVVLDGSVVTYVDSAGRIEQAKLGGPASVTIATDG